MHTHTQQPRDSCTDLYTPTHIHTHTRTHMHTHTHTRTQLVKLSSVTKFTQFNRFIITQTSTDIIILIAESLKSIWKSEDI